MCPPGGKSEQRERDAAEQRRLDSLERPEAARRLIDRMGVAGTVLDKAMRRADAEFEPHRDGMAELVARVLAQDPGVIEVRASVSDSPGRGDRRDEALAKPRVDEDPRREVAGEADDQRRYRAPPDHADRRRQAERKEDVAERRYALGVERAVYVP